MSLKLPDYYSPRVSSELPDCSLPLTFDVYSRCSMSCQYCFAASQKAINPGTKEAPLQAVNPNKFFAAIDGISISKESKLFHKHFYSKKFLLHIGGLADSFCHYERKYGASYPIIKGLLERKYPIMFSSKGPMIADPIFVQLFEKYKDQNTAAFQFSIVTADDELAKKVEPGVPAPSQRFEYMKYLSSLGYWCVLRLRPFIIGVTDLTLPKILEKAFESGARAVSTEFYAMDHRCVGKMRKATDDLAKLMGIKDVGVYFNTLSPKERGGYCRLNRLVKEQYVKYIYKFCLEHNMVFACSDPDFKELCQTGCCCGLPPAGQHPTKDMNNWSSHQLTAKIMDARIQYHKTGECTSVRFNEVYAPKDWIFDEQGLSHQDIGCTKFVYAIRKQLTLRSMMQAKWNNLNSYANPQSYFHGKVVPVGLDESRENLLYKYNPMGYEQRWKDEGIRLDMEWKDGKYV